jgi:hypothetical protein
MAETFRKVYLIDRESARRVLVSEGICTLDGRLTKEYGG